MCTQSTTNLCNNLAALSLAARQDPHFDAWLCDVAASMRNKGAPARTTRSLRKLYDDGFTPAFVAEKLDRRHEAFGVRLFRTKVMA